VGTRGDVAEGVGQGAEEAGLRRRPPGTALAAALGRRWAVLTVASGGQALQTGQEALGRGRRGGLGEDALELPLGIGLGLALRAGGEVGQDALTRLVTEFSVHQGGEPVSQMLFGRCGTK
jgi:hypothetical protein